MTNKELVEKVNAYLASLDNNEPIEVYATNRKLAWYELTDFLKYLGIKGEIFTN